MLKKLLLHPYLLKRPLGLVGLTSQGKNVHFFPGREEVRNTEKNVTKWRPLVIKGLSLLEEFLIETSDLFSSIFDRCLIFVR